MTDERRYTPGGISLDERLTIIDEKLDKIIDLYTSVDKRVSLIESKIDLHDKILMGVCGAVGVAVLTAVLTLVIK